MIIHGKEVKENTIDGIEINLSNSFANRQLFIHQKKDASYYIN